MPLPLSTPRSLAEEDVKNIQRQSPLLNLPSEIRLLIYSHLLPRNTDISIHPITRKSNKGAPVPGHFWEPGIRAVGGLWLSILLVCRLCHDEAADVLYGTNRFHFFMTSRERMWYSFNPQSLNKPYARGLPINTLRIFPSSALRRMRSVSIRIEEDISRPDSYHRVQTWLAEAVSRFDGGAGALPGSLSPSPQQQQQHGLQELTATLVCGEFSYGSFALLNTGDLYWEFRPAAPGPASVAACLYQFILEPLAQLRSIKKVEIQGHVTPAFAQRLADTMMIGSDQSAKSEPARHGERGHYQEGDGPGILCYDVQRVHPGKKRRRGVADSEEAVSLVRSSRKFFEPMLDWGLTDLHDPDAMEVDEDVEDEDESKREARIPQTPSRTKWLG